MEMTNEEKEVLLEATRKVLSWWDVALDKQADLMYDSTSGSFDQKRCLYILSISRSLDEMGHSRQDQEPWIQGHNSKFKAPPLDLIVDGRYKEVDSYLAQMSAGIRGEICG